jgi:hypothetical protein
MYWNEIKNQGSKTFNQINHEENARGFEQVSETFQDYPGLIYDGPFSDHITTMEPQGLTGNEMWNRIKDKLQCGSIILSHNGTKHTAESLDMLIKNIKLQGFELVKVSELIYRNNYTINNNGTFEQLFISALYFLKDILDLKGTNKNEEKTSA